MEKKARETLTRFGMRPSPQRLAILEYLLAHRTHPTADEIYSALQPRIPTLSRTTVYNTVSMLVSRGVIRTLNFDPDQLHFDGETAPHAHFQCTRCGKIHDIWPDAAGWRSIRSAVPPPGEVSAADLQIFYKGLCAECHAQS